LFTMVFLDDHFGALARTAGKSSSTIFSIAAENVAENSTWLG